MVERALLRVGEAAEMLGLGRSKVYTMASRGEIPVLRLGRAVRIPRSLLLEWISSNAMPARDI
jgi:excisionase family DNA binding protein